MCALARAFILKEGLIEHFNHLSIFTVLCTVAKTGSIKYWHIASDVASYKEIFNIDNINDIGTVTLLKHGNYLIFACITIVVSIVKLIFMLV